MDSRSGAARDPFGRCQHDHATVGVGQDVPFAHRTTCRKRCGEVEAAQQRIIANKLLGKSELEEIINHRAYNQAYGDKADKR